MAERSFRTALVLSGGNALGAYHGGAFEVLQAHGIEPQHVVGASAGAVTGALLCGNPPEAGIAWLRELWKPDSAEPSPPPAPPRRAAHGSGAEDAHRRSA